MLLKRKNWTRDETLLAFRLYCFTPFGNIHKGNSTIISLAAQIGRTPSAIVMKLVNFASLDPVQQRRGVQGLKNASALDLEIWKEFKQNSESIAYESQEVLELRGFQVH